MTPAGAALRAAPPSPLLEGGKIVLREGDEDEAVGVGGDIGETERAFPLLGAALTKREQAAEPAIGGAVRGVGKQARRIVEIESRRRR